MEHFSDFYGCDLFYQVISETIKQSFASIMPVYLKLLNLHPVSTGRFKILHFMPSYMNPNKNPKQTVQTGNHF